MSRPPLPDWLIRALCRLLPSRYREEVYGDLVEEARARTRAGWGRNALRAWLLLQILRSIPILNLNALERTMDRLDQPLRSGGAIAYGIVSGLLIFGLLHLAPQPAGTLVLDAFIALSLFVAGFVTLRRTDFVFMGTGMLLGSLEAVALWVLVATGAVSAPPTEPWLLIPAVGSVVVWLGLMALEKRRAPEEYETWKRTTERATLVDILFLRHIPHMR